MPSIQPPDINDMLRKIGAIQAVLHRTDLTIAPLDTARQMAELQSQLVDAYQEIRVRVEEIEAGFLKTDEGDRDFQGHHLFHADTAKARRGLWAMFQSVRTWIVIGILGGVGTIFGTGVLEWIRSHLK